MRKMLLILLLLWLVPVQAQNLNFVCEDGTSYQKQVTILPPAIDETMSDIVVTALASEVIIPVIGISTEDAYTYCNFGAADAAYYHTSLPAFDAAVAEDSAQEFISDFGANQVQIGDFNGRSGNFLVIFESQISETNHVYQLAISPEMLAAGAMNAYLFALTGEYQPSLSITAPEQEPILGEATEASLETLYDVSETVVFAAIPQVEGSVDITVEANTEGFYALVLAISTGEAVLGDADAEMTRAEDVSLSLRCAGDIVYENGIQFFVPDDNAYTVTVVSGDNDPILALLNTETSGRCFDDSFEAGTYSANLPSLEVLASSASAQVQISPDDEAVLIGGRESGVGDYLVFVEGGTIEAGEADEFALEVSPQMVSAFEYLRVYVFAADESLDPVLTYAAEEAIVCDNAGDFETCPEESSSLFGTSLSLAERDFLNGIDLNPMLEIPIDEGMAGNLLNFSVSSANETAGSYVIVFHYITD